MELIFPETHHTQHRVVRMFVSEQQKRYHTRHLNLTLKHINIIVPESAIAIAIDCCNILCITTWFSTPSENPWKHGSEKAKNSNYNNDRSGHSICPLLNHFFKTLFVAIVALGDEVAA